MLKSCLAALACLALAGTAYASPSTVTPDRMAVLVSKDINGQRWAISRDVATGVVSGNVFDPAGGDPSFVWCDQTGETLTKFQYACYGTGPCTVADCAESWVFLTNVPLAKSFFAAGDPVIPTPTPVPTRTPAPTRTPQPARCSTNGPLTDFTINCSRYVYFYRFGVTVAGITSNGSLAIVCMANSAGLLCARGAPIIDVLASLTQANFDGGPYGALDPGSSMELGNDGRGLDVLLNANGERFEFFGFNYFNTDRLSSENAAALFAPPQENALEGAMRTANPAEFEAAVRRMIEAAGD